MMNTIKRVTIAALLVVVAGGSLVSEVDAQSRFPDRRNNDDRNERIEDFRDDVEDLLKEIDRNADRFVRELDKDLDRSRVNDRRQEDQINNLAREIQRHASNARRDFDREGSVRDDISQLISATNTMERIINGGSRLNNGGSRLNNGGSRLNLSGNTQRYWSELRNDVDRLEDYTGRANRFDRNDSNNRWWR